MKDELTSFIQSLTEPQLRALACQAGITAWAVRPVPELKERCRCHAKGVDIYEENYGKEAGLPE